MNTIRLTGFVLRSPNIEKTRTFYEQILHVTFERHTDHGAPHYAAAVGNVLLEIYPSHISADAALPSRDSPILITNDLEAILKRVTPEQISKNPTSTSYGSTALLTDPDGRLVVVMEELEVHSYPHHD